jgi:hypothetical protein
MAENTAPHPLFAVDEDDDPDAEAPEIGHITVKRWEGGRQFTAPRLFRADELTSLEELYATFGGGKYELIGRSVDNSRIVARRSYEIPGPAKPMFAEPEHAASAPKAEGPDMGALVALLRAQQPAGSGFSAQTLIALLGVVAPVLQQWLQNNAQQQAAMQANNQQFLATLLTNSSQQTDKLVSVMGTLYTSGAGGKGAGSGDYRAGMEFMRDFLAGQMEAQAEGADEPSIKDLIGLANTFLANQANNQKSNPPPAMNGASS